MAVCDLAVVFVEDEGLSGVSAFFIALEDDERLLVLALHQVGTDERALQDLIVLNGERNDARRVDVVDPDVSACHGVVFEQCRVVESYISADRSGCCQTFELFAVHNAEAVVVQDLLHALELLLIFACVDLYDLAQVRVIGAASFREVELLQGDLLVVQVLPGVEVALLVGVPLVTLFDDVLGCLVVLEAQLLQFFDGRCDFCLVIHSIGPSLIC